MLRGFALAFLALTGIMRGLPAAALDQTLQVVTNADDSPYSMLKDQEVVGVASDMIRMALAEFGVTAKFANRGGPGNSDSMIS